MNAIDLTQDDMKIGFIGTYGNRIANMLIDECDLLLSVGARLGLRQVGHMPEKFARKAHLIRADIDQCELSRDIKCNEEKYLIDAKAFMEMLLNENIPSYIEWYEKCIKAKALLDEYDNTAGNKVIDKISSLLPPNPIVTVDVGQHMCWTAQTLTLKGNSGRILIGGSYGSMGCGLPYAIGASISRNKGIVYCITGDGGLQMNIQELETVKREMLPIKILVINNEVLGKISEIQEGSYHKRFAQTTKESGYTVPAFEKIASAYGIRAAALTSYEDLRQYEDWLLDKKPCLINIFVPEANILIPKIKWETYAIQPELDKSKLTQIKEILE